MDKLSQSLFDIIFPQQMRQQIGLTDKEAGVLYSMWKDSPVGADRFSSNDIDGKTMNSLKIKGYLAGFGDGVELTEKGKKIIVEMVTHEPNALDKKASNVQYSSIKNKTQRQKQAFKKKTASKTASERTFNLRRESLRRMGDK